MNTALALSQVGKHALVKEAVFKLNGIKSLVELLSSDYEDVQVVLQVV